MVKKSEIMKKPKVFGVYGKSNSGKTSLIVQIIKHLTKNGYKIATVKISDKDINLDSKGKDTWMHSKAGSNLTVLSSKNETGYLLKQYKDTEEILKSIALLDNYDLVLIEGANDNTTKKIRLGNIKKRSNTILTFDGDFEKLIKIIQNEIMR